MGNMSCIQRDGSARPKKQSVEIDKNNLSSGGESDMKQDSRTTAKKVDMSTNRGIRARGI